MQDIPAVTLKLKQNRIFVVSVSVQIKTDVQKSGSKPLMSELKVSAEGKKNLRDKVRRSSDCTRDTAKCSV